MRGISTGIPYSPQSLGCAGEGRNGRGLIVPDVEEVVHFGDLEQVNAGCD